MLVFPLTQASGFSPVAPEEQFVRCDATSAAFTQNLPDATVQIGQKITLKKVDSSANAVTIGRQGTQTIDGATSYTLSAQWKYVTVISDGSNWLIVGSN